MKILKPGEPNIPGMKIVSNGNSIGLNDGSDKIFPIFKPQGLTYDSICTGINFREILKTRLGLNVEDYYMVESYETSWVGAKVIAREIDGLPESRRKDVKLLLPQGGMGKWQKTLTIPVYEYAKKDDPTQMIVIIDPKPERYGMEVICAQEVYVHEFEVPGEAAIEYLTSESLFMTSPDEIRDITESLCQGDVPESLKEALDSYDPTEEFAMWDWGSIQGRHKDYDFTQNPWRLKLFELREKMTKVICDPRLCFHIKARRFMKLVKTYINVYDKDDSRDKSI
jgi:hypothetical protein